MSINLHRLDPRPYLRGKNKMKPWHVGFVQASSLLLYIVLFSYISINTVFNGSYGDSIFFIIFPLIAFATSVLVCGSIVFAFPAYLALNKAYKEAIQIVAYTAGFLVLLLILTVLLTKSFNVI